MRGLLFIAVAARLGAQPPTLALNLAEAKRLALQNNPQIAGARLTAAAAYQVAPQYKAALSPLVSGNLTGVGADSGTRLAAGSLNNPVVYDRIASGLTVSQLLTDFGRTSNLVASATLRAQAQDQIAETSRADILVGTARAYYGLLRANAVLKVARQTVSARQIVADQVTALAKSQLKSALDVSFANVNLAEAELLVSQAENDVKSSEAQLAAAMGLPQQTGFSLSEEDMPDALPDRVDPLIQQALQDRPEIKDLRLEQSAAERFARAERALNFPSIGVSGSAGFAPAAEAVIPGRYGAVGVNVSIPIFNGGAFHARQTEAELQARAATEHINDMANRVTRDVRVAYLNSITAFDRLGLTEKLLRQSQLALDLAQGRYDLGLSSIVELSQAQLNLTSAQIANAAARYDYQTQRAVLDYQTGSLR